MIFLTVYYTSGLRRAGHDTGDWSNGMIGVSKTFGGSSILSSPALNLVKERLFVCLLEKVNTEVNTGKKQCYAYKIICIHTIAFCLLRLNLAISYGSIGSLLKMPRIAKCRLSEAYINMVLNE